MNVCKKSHSESSRDSIMVVSRFSKSFLEDFMTLHFQQSIGGVGLVRSTFIDLSPLPNLLFFLHFA